ncbi:hypothetical protein EB796_007828 [Bugula neritina]|uniref:Uncharacterized protein n=1 Tax=Bugula neritina TaxID=10212 RepID=A0A7J7K8H6_BUGNE|nr:hypothetical protein EB796_007828 [Bugula neritina]
MLQIFRCLLNVRCSHGEASPSLVCSSRHSSWSSLVIALYLSPACCRRVSPACRRRVSPACRRRVSLAVNEKLILLTIASHLYLNTS